MTNLDFTPQTEAAEPELLAWASSRGARVMDMTTGEILQNARDGTDVRSTARARLRGLSNGHISPHGQITGQNTWKVTLWPEGGLVKVTRPSAFNSPSHEGGTRGECAAMSRASRRRFMYKMAQIRRRVIPLFVTLTYPGEFAGDVRTVKRDMDVFAKRLERLGACAVWRVEWKERLSGASIGQAVPHYHLLLWLPPEMHLEEFKRWCSQSWYEVVGSRSAAHLQAGTKCEVMRSWRGVMAYASKYIAKVDESVVPKGAGRAWGVVCRHTIPWDVPQTELITGAQGIDAFKMCEIIAGEIWRQENPSRTVFYEQPATFMQCVNALGQAVIT